jgi:exopolysaccharide biosynthesis polyprenyl glycosylphosphotransferase
MQRKKDIHLYIFADFFAAVFTWILFFSFRKIYLENLGLKYTYLIEDINFILGISLIPLFWLLIYFSSNSYEDIYKKSTLIELFKSIIQTLIGASILFFVIMLNDKIEKYHDYYMIFLAYIIMHLTFLLCFRYLVLLFAKKNILSKRISIPSIILGNNTDIQNIKKHIDIDKNILQHQIIAETNFEQAINLITEKNYEEAFVASTNPHSTTFENIIIACLSNNIGINILANDLDILSGKYKTQNIFGSNFLFIPPFILSTFQSFSKRLVDIIAAVVGLIFLLPMFIIISIIIKKSTAGNVLYKQERVGKNGRLFTIYKFRTMLENAENETPLLTQQNDNRITKIGKLLRKYRIDELPQLYNVLIGDMSLVGPRPERKFFVDQLIEKSPKYKLIQNVQPGITSLGMVKFGYAHNLLEMQKRLRFDLIYLENRSFILDIKILFYTINTVLTGKGL